MKIKALVSFAGAFSMYKGQIKDIENGDLAKDLLGCKYVEEVKEETLEEKETLTTEEIVVEVTKDEVKDSKKTSKGKARKNEA